ncbi:hypothetical protein ElyMa_006113800 [Elysia marginata]|uniref:Uncharacterized protein n=1 Tax=Elysia marginata TaxID=1093978 RepID=A0AAV4GV15_9GAST|nr:hypothetical protein ElyMa_006113800 [Elysia marginata]
MIVSFMMVGQGLKSKAKIVFTSLNRIVPPHINRKKDRESHRSVADGELGCVTALKRKKIRCLDDDNVWRNNAHGQRGFYSRRWANGPSEPVSVSIFRWLSWIFFLMGFVLLSGSIT